MQQSRILCWEDTYQKCKNLPTKEKSTKIHYVENFDVHTNKKHLTSDVFFYNMDTIDCALHFDNPLVLNLASNYHPGGGVARGSGAQEESLFRRSNYFKTLTKNFYPINDNEAIYSPKVSVIKKDENDNWLPYLHPVKLDFIACPGIRYPKTIIKNNETKLHYVDVRRLKNKIETIIQCAIQYNHDTIIFGALGCGVWNNPPHHVAEIFKNILTKYDGVIKNYVFAILGTYNDNTNFYKTTTKPDNNVDVFIKIFDKSKVDTFPSEL